MEKPKIIFFDWSGTIYSKEVAERANLKRADLFGESIDKDLLIKLQHSNYDDHYGLVKSMIREGLNLKNPDNIVIYQAVLFGFYYNLIAMENPQKYLLINLEKLKELKEKHNLKFVIVTGLWEGTFEGTINALKLNEIFDKIYSLDVYLSASKKDNIAKAINDMKDCEPFAMIGDKGEDIESGKANGLKTIFCSYGHGSVDNADITINTPEELIEAIGKIITP